MIYKLKSGSDPFELNPGLRAVAEFDKLTSRQMFFVILVCDPSRDNPIATLAGLERREKAAKIAGYPYEADGKRLDKNGRETRDGKIESVEKAILAFKENHYNQRHRSIEALRKQIAEIRDFLESEKKLPLLEKGKQVFDELGEPMVITDQKGLKLAVELGKDLPNLEAALDALEAANKEDIKFEGQTFTAVDLTPENEADQDIPAIEKFHLARQKND